MAEGETCHLKSQLLTIADDLEKARTLDQLHAQLVAERKLWRGLRHQMCLSCRGNAELAKLTRFVLDVLGESVIPDDNTIAALVGINLRAAALLTQKCPTRPAGDGGSAHLYTQADAMMPAASAR